MQKILNKLSGQNSVKGATVILIVTLFLSNILGLVRDHFLAQKITTSMLDTYYTAFRIPDLIFNLLILGAITASFIPVFSQYLTKNNLKEAWHISNSFLNIGVVILSIALIILFFLMPTIIPWMVPDFDAEKMKTTINLSRLLLISPLLFTISYTFGSILNSFKRFLIYSLAPLVYNLCIILATIFFTDQYSVYAVAYGVLIGAFLHMFIQFIQLKILGYKHKFVFDWKNKSVQKIFYLMIPRAVGLGVNQIMLVVYTAIASTFVAGSIAIFNLADNIQTMPTVVFGISFATAIFPTLTEHINLGKMQDFSIHIFKSVRSIIYVLIPITLIIILLRAQIVRLILGSGYFGWDQTILTYNTLAMFCISLLAQGLIPLFARAFYAMSDTKTPTYVSIASVIIGIVLGYIFGCLWGVVGLALAFSCASIFNALALYVVLSRNVKEIKQESKGIGLYTLKVVLATLLMGIIIQLVKYGVTYFVDMDRFWGILTQTFLAATTGIILYAYISRLFGCEEQQQVVQLIKKYLLPNAKKQS